LSVWYTCTVPQSCIIWCHSKSPWGRQLGKCTSVTFLWSTFGGVIVILFILVMRHYWSCFSSYIPKITYNICQEILYWYTRCIYVVLKLRYGTYKCMKSNWILIFLRYNNFKKINLTNSRNLFETEVIRKRYEEVQLYCFSYCLMHSFCGLSFN
jgi:hypothetical protein